MDLQILARIESLVSEKEAMIAENKQREFLNQAMAYDYSDLMDIANQLTELGRNY